MILVPLFDLKFLQRRSLPDRRGVLNSPLGPQPIDAAADTEPRASPDVALKRLAVVADMLDDAHRPILGQADLLAEIAFGADQALDLRHVRFQGLVDVL